MATMDDKLLGEKLHYYCSSSEDEADEKPPTVTKDPPPPVTQWDGSASNTGPKGVIKDWQRYKQLETEKREEHDREKVELAKKLSMTCRTAAEDDEGGGAMMGLVSLTAALPLLLILSDDVDVDEERPPW